jgi:hypothetical protein
MRNMNAKLILAAIMVVSVFSILAKVALSLGLTA